MYFTVWPRIVFYTIFHTVKYSLFIEIQFGLYLVNNLVMTLDLDLDLDLLSL